MPKLISALCTLVTLVGASLSSLQAETIYALSETADTPSLLFSFDSAAPSVITTPQHITGLLGFPTTLAIRPADGQLYTLLGTNVYRIDPATAQATLLFSSPGLNIGISTMAFNPVTGLLRVIGTRGEAQTLSFRVNVDTGAVIQDGQSPCRAGWPTPMPTPGRARPRSTAWTETFSRLTIPKTSHDSRPWDSWACPGQTPAPSSAASAFPA